MGGEDFNATLLRNLKAVKFSKDGGIEVPVRANGRDGIVFGMEAISKADEAAADTPLLLMPAGTAQWGDASCDVFAKPRRHPLIGC